jgi:hypothetical protein
MKPVALRLPKGHFSVGNKLKKEETTIIPSISLKKTPELIEVEKTTLLEFIISGESRWGKNDLVVELINEDKDVRFSTLKWTNVDYGFTIKTNITPNKAGEIEIKFKVNNKETNPVIIETKYILQEPKIVEEQKVIYTDEQKAKLIATVYGESAGAINLMVEIPWIYYNITKKNINLLSWSSFYANRNREPEQSRYRICMYYLGEGNEFKDHISAETDNKKIKDYCVDSNPDFVKYYKNDLEIIKNAFEKNIYNPDKILNPYSGWKGQGYYGDMNIRMNTSKTKWAKASQYFHLQNKGFVKYLYVKEIIAYNRWGQDATTYLCNDDLIEKYFKENPSKLPKYEEGKGKRNDGTRYLIDANEKNAIPGVRFRKDKQK